MDEPRAGDRLLASACQFLRDGGEESLARLLATCSARVIPTNSPGVFGGTQFRLDIYITAPRAAYDLLTANDNDQWDSNDDCSSVVRAINAVIASGIARQIHVLAELLDPDDDWRAQYGAVKPDDAPVPPALPAATDSDDIPF